MVMCPRLDAGRLTLEADATNLLVCPIPRRDADMHAIPINPGLSDFTSSKGV